MAHVRPVASRVLVAALAGVTLGPAVEAAPAAPFEGQLRFRVFGEDEGLGNSVVMALLQDRVGFLWVGTQNGLYRYDGREFRPYGPESGLTSPLVTALHETADGSLYVGLYVGLARRDGDVFRRYDEADGVPQARVYPGGIASDPDGSLYVGTERGLLVGRKDRFRLESAPEGTRDPAVRTVHVSPKGELYFAREGRLFRRVRDREEEVGTRLGLPRGDILDIASDLSGRLFVTSLSALFVLEPRAQRFLRERAPYFAHSSGGPAALDPQGSLLLPTGHGLARRISGSWSLLTRSQGLPADSVTTALVDREGSLWVGLTVGLAQLLGGFTAYGLAEGLPDEVWSVTREKRSDGRPGALWVGTEQGLHRLDPTTGRLRSVDAEGGRRRRLVFSLAAAQDGSLFVGAWPGLMRLGPEPGVVRHYRAPGLGPDLKVRRLLAGANHEVWAATPRGVLRLMPGADRFEAAFPAPPAEAGISDLTEDVDGTVFAAGDAGLYRLNGPHPRIFTAADGLVSTALFSVVAMGGELVVSYREMHGVSRLKVEGDRLRLLPLSGSGELASPNVMLVNKDEAGNLWVGTDKGLDVFYRDGSHTHFGRADGLISQDIMQHAFHADPDGTVWVGTARGLARYRGSAGAPGRVPPVVVLTSVSGGQRQLATDAPARLGREERTLRVSWAGLTFRDAGSLRYRYRLVGLEDELVETKLREARYPSLAPGSYRFEVTAVSGAGLASEGPAVFGFEIVPAWWERSTVRALAVVLGLAGVGGGLRLWFRRQMARRILAAREQLRALRAQLNPHFLFNVLHSLSVLVRSDPAAAEKALEHLGAMLRYVLDEGLGEEVELAEELGFVEHYLALESLRYGARLRVRREVEPGALDAVIPAFSLQLLVENAVRHGIARAKEGGTVEIRAFEAGDRVTLAVKDDGPGTTPEAALLAKGLGLRALRQRLQALHAGRAALDLRTAPGAGFEATIVLPQERGPGAP